MRPVNYVWIDNDGERANTRLYVKAAVGAGDFANLQANLTACSNAALLYRAETKEHVEPTPGTPDSGTYAVIREALALEFRSVVTGLLYTYHVPAPDEALIGVDDETVVATDSDMDGVPDVIQAGILAITANATDPHGNALTFSRAYRSKTRFYKAN